MLDENQRFAHAVFKDAEHASAAVHQLMESHFATEQIAVLMVRGPEVQELPLKHKTFVPHGVALGAIVGAAAGALTLTGLGIVAAGPILIALQGAAAGTAVGSLGGALGGLGFWRDEVDFPSDAFASGAVLVGVVTNAERVDDARAALTSVGAGETYVSTKEQATEAATAKQSVGNKRDAGKQIDHA
jgi:hypothetical protein